MVGTFIKGSFVFRVCVLNSHPLGYITYLQSRWDMRRPEKDDTSQRYLISLHLE